MILKKIVALPPINEEEVLRYAGCQKEAKEFLPVIRECASIISFSPQVCYIEVPVSVNENIVDFGLTSVCSASLAKLLSNCKKAIIFAATVGFSPDMATAKYGHISPQKALFCQALGAERIEILCDKFCSDYPMSTPRFSPGYGDLPLEFQKDIFKILDCPRQIGVTLSDSLLMSPTKSVTAVFGIRKD